MSINSRATLLSIWLKQSNAPFISAKQLLKLSHKIGPNKAPGRISLAKNLTIRYSNTNKNVLDRLSFVINPGELVAVVGPVGCGKTTLARALGRMVDVSKGELFLNDYDVFDNAGGRYQCPAYQ